MIERYSSNPQWPRVLQDPLHWNWKVLENMSCSSAVMGDLDHTLAWQQQSEEVLHTLPNGGKDDQRNNDIAYGKIPFELILTFLFVFISRKVTHLKFRRHWAAPVWVLRKVWIGLLSFIGGHLRHVERKNWARKEFFRVLILDWNTVSMLSF